MSVNDDIRNELQSFVDKVESEGFDYAMQNYSPDLDLPEYQKLSRAYDSAQNAIREYLTDLCIEHDVDPEALEY